jgi:hypothetical protein
MKMTYSNTITTVLLSLLCLVSTTGFTGCAEGAGRAKENSGNEYYLSASGSDLGTGSSDSPWKTIEKLNSINLKPGDAVYFEGGSTFEGTIILGPDDSGNPERNVVIGSFGSGRATISGGTREGLSAE